MYYYIVLTHKDYLNSKILTKNQIDEKYKKFDTLEFNISGNTVIDYNRYYPKEHTGIVVNDFIPYAIGPFETSLQALFYARTKRYNIMKSYSTDFVSWVGSTKEYFSDFHKMRIGEMVKYEKWVQGLKKNNSSLLL